MPDRGFQSRREVTSIFITQITPGVKRMIKSIRSIRSRSDERASFKSLSGNLLRCHRSLGQIFRAGLECLEDRVVPSSLTYYTPSEIRQAYGISQLNYTGKGTTIAIIGENYDSTIQSDLTTFDNTYDIQSTDFIQIGAGGVAASSLPPASSSDSDPQTQETALDVEWAHAIAPSADILLVEYSPSGFGFSSSDSAFTTAASYSAPGVPPVMVISSSYNLGYDTTSNETAENSDNVTYTTPSNHDGIVYVQAAGDAANTDEWPAASSNVLSVGGTTLSLNGSNYGSETAWSSGSYSTVGVVSATQPEPDFQLESVPAASDPSKGRAVADLSMDASGVEIYDTGSGGAETSSGTSSSAPQIAGLIALADQGRIAEGKPTLEGDSSFYDLPESAFHGITQSNGSVSSGFVLPTGLGSPIANVLVPDLVNDAGSLPAESAIYDSDGDWTAQTNDGTTYQIDGWGGDSGDIPVVGDFDGVGHAELAIYRLVNNVGYWYIATAWAPNLDSPSTDSITSFYVVKWGYPGGVPVTGDFTGDGHQDLGIYNPSDGEWDIAYSWADTNNSYATAQFPTGEYAVQFGGGSGQVPVPADYTGSGHVDLALYQTSTGDWDVTTSWPTTGQPGDPAYANPGFGVQFGGGNYATPVPSDYTGAGHADLAVYTTNTADWDVATAFPTTYSTGNPGPAGANGTFFGVQYGYGNGGSVPVPNDYTGAGHSDMAVYEPSTGSVSIATTWSTGYTPASPGPAGMTYSFSLGMSYTYSESGRFDYNGNGAAAYPQVLTDTSAQAPSFQPSSSLRTSTPSVLFSFVADAKTNSSDAARPQIALGTKSSSSLPITLSRRLIPQGPSKLQRIVTSSDAEV